MGRCEDASPHLVNGMVIRERGRTARVTRDPSGDIPGHHWAVSGTLVETKLRVPRGRATQVNRQRMADVLDRSRSARLTLVSAPPGFGKTTLIATWARSARAAGAAVAWLSLDPADTDPARFWSYLLAAIETAAREAAVDVDLGPVRAPSGGIDMDALVDALDRVSADLTIVLDDLHVIASGPIHEDLAALLERMPEHVHLVVTTRADPPLPLARLRVRGELVEIRAADLRFDQAEAATFLRDVMGLTLSTQQVAALEVRTEGWAAALQLAALSMAGRADVEPFIARFTGNDRHVVDYLADEVLGRQPEVVRRFLLHTAILDRLSAPLCDAVTGRRDGKTLLETLDRANLFLVRLDDERRWYRYHHLFADVLRARLLDEDPDAIPDLHRRAGAWWEEQGDLAEAIRHALAADDEERAADLIELAAHDLRGHRQERTLRDWLDRLPDTLFHRRPMLAIVHVGALLATGETRGVEARLDAAERWTAAAGSEAARIAAVAEGMVVHRLDVLHHLPSAIALHRAGLARMGGDHEATVVHARAAMAAAGEDLPLERGGGAGLLALAAWSQGDLEAAEAGWSAAIVDLERAGHHGDVLGCTIGLSDVRIAQGRLTEARRTLEDALLHAERLSPPPRGRADMHDGLAALHHEWGDLTEARRHLDLAAELGESAGLPQHPYRWRVALALVRHAEGRLDEATDLLDEAERRYDGDFFPEVRPVPAVRARIWLAAGRIGEARTWARAAGVSARDPVTYLREYELLTLAQVLLAEGAAGGGEGVGPAVALLERIIVAAEAGGRRRSHIEALVLLASAQQAAGDGSAAAALEEALVLAAPQGYVRTFLDAGEGVHRLLRDASKQGPARARASHVLQKAIARGRAHPTQAALIEPLSERELDVLRLLGSDLDGPAIARELYVSLNTMRTHTKNIFAKLGVNSRREAVRRAGALGLLDRRGGTGGG
jgi:LuxR family maltose regulon positive regulatory protein